MGGWIRLRQRIDETVGACPRAPSRFFFFVSPGTTPGIVPRAAGFYNDKGQGLYNPPGTQPASPTTKERRGHEHPSDLHEHHLGPRIASERCSLQTEVSDVAPAGGLARDPDFLSAVETRSSKEAGETGLARSLKSGNLTLRAPRAGRGPSGTLRAALAFFQRRPGCAGGWAALPPPRCTPRGRVCRGSIADQGI